MQLAVLSVAKVKREILEAARGRAVYFAYVCRYWLRLCNHKRMISCKFTHIYTYKYDAVWTFIYVNEEETASVLEGKFTRRLGNWKVEACRN